MLLSPQETERFYRIWFPLLHYVNTQLQLVPAFPAAPGKEEVSTADIAQEREGLIISLCPEGQGARETHQRSALLARNSKVFTGFRRELRKAGLSPQTVETHVAAIADFAYTTLLDADPPRGVLNLTFADIQSYLSETSGKQPLTSFKRFVRFLLSTGRIDYETGENLYELLKEVSKGD